MSRIDITVDDVKAALDRNDGLRAAAARDLGVSPATLQRRINEYRLQGYRAYGTVAASQPAVDTAPPYKKGTVLIYTGDRIPDLTGKQVVVEEVQMWSIGYVYKVRENLGVKLADQHYFIDKHSLIRAAATYKGSLTEH